jgi:phospholipid/cholesterol/gamma-HCH transport system substrate-binding protein
MQSSRSIEIWVGIFVALGFAALLMLAMKVSHLGDLFMDKGYTVTAKFQNVGGLKIKSPVKMAGVRIGRVGNIQLDEATYEAIVTMQIDGQFNKLPKDTNASIFTAGLLGEQYVGLKEGAEEEYLKANDQITLTQPALVLEQLIGQFLVNFASGSSDKKSK